MSTLAFENGNLRLEFDRATGALVGLTAVRSGWKILDRPELGLSFRLLLPLSEERRNNPVYGEKQTLTRLEVSPDGRSALFLWDGVTSESGGKHDIRLTLRVTLDDAQAVFAMTVENHSALSSKTSTAPTWAMCSTPPDAEWFKTFIYPYATAKEWLALAHLSTTCAATTAWTTRPSSSPRRASCRRAHVALHPAARRRSRDCTPASARPSTELVAWHTELRPGYGSSIDARVPEAAQHRAAATWPPALPPCTCPTSSPARRAR